MEFKSEIGRNLTGYFLVSIGLVALAYGGHTRFDKMIEASFGLISAGLYAFQAKRSPDGQTTSVQVTTPDPKA